MVLSLYVVMQNLCKMEAYEGSLFKDNEAQQQGGVVCAMELSNVLFNGSRVVNNSAPLGIGGVMALEARTGAVLGGRTYMARNSAAEGGVVGMTTGSTLRLEGECVLENNTAAGELKRLFTLTYGPCLRAFELRQAVHMRELMN